MTVEHSNTASTTRWLPAVAASLIGAVFGGLAWAYVVNATGFVYGFLSIPIGFLVGFCLLFLGKSPPISLRQKVLYYAIGPVSTLVGIATGKILDIKWRVMTELADNSSVTFDFWLAVKQSILPHDLFFFLAACYFSYRIPSSRIWQSLVQKKEFSSNDINTL